MKKIKISELPEKYRDMIFELSFVNDEDFMGFVNLKDEYFFEDGSHVNAFESKEDLIDLLKEAYLLKGKRLFMEHYVDEYQMGAVVKDPEKEIQNDGFVRIVWENNSYETIIDPEFDKPVNLNDCLKMAFERGYKDGVIFVTYDGPLKGVIFIYGNYLDNSWYVYGKTIGYC